MRNQSIPGRVSVCNQPGYEAKNVHAAIASYNRLVDGTLSVVSRLSKCRGFTVYMENQMKTVHVIYIMQACMQRRTN